MCIVATHIRTALAIAYALMTTPLYRAWVLLQVNPPTVQIMDESSAGSVEDTSSYDFVATQVGLLSSRSLGWACTARASGSTWSKGTPNLIPPCPVAM